MVGGPMGSAATSVGIHFANMSITIMTAIQAAAISLARLSVILTPLTISDLVVELNYEEGNHNHVSRAHHGYSRSCRGVV